MSRLFYVAGDPELAKRTLRLYAQIVSKAREASVAEAENATADSAGAFGAGKDIDDDYHWVQTLVQGARMLSRLALAENDSAKAVEEAKEAGEMIARAKHRLDITDKALVASVQLAEAVWHVAVAYAGEPCFGHLQSFTYYTSPEQDVLTRSQHFEASLTLLHASLETSPSSSTHHHLALAYLRPGASQDVQTAIVHARAAVEGDPSEIRHWHLLGLLLTASGDWRAAKEVLEMGESVSEADLADDEDDQHDSQQTNGDVPDGVHVHDYGASTNEPDEDTPDGSVRSEINGVRGESSRLLERDATELPPSAALLQPLGDRPSPNRQDVFEHALQLRTTQLTLTEFVEGPEGTGDRWVEVFQWFSERREVGVDDSKSPSSLRTSDQHTDSSPGRMSIDSRRASHDIKAASITSSIEKRAGGPSAGRPSAQFPAVEEQPEPTSTTTLDAPPITVTPASPLPQTAFSQDQVNRTSLNGKEEGSGEKRLSVDDGQTNRGKGKKVREVFISGVHKGRARVTTISRKIGHNVGRHNGVHIKRSNSAPGTLPWWLAK